MRPRTLVVRWKDMVLKSTPIFIILLSVVFCGGCANKLPDVNRIQNNMDMMVANMSYMAQNTNSIAHNTAAMAGAALRLEKKSDTMMSDFNKKGSSAERSIQNYTQAFLDNERAMIKGLQAIRQELSDIKVKIHPDAAIPPGPAAANLQSRLNDIDRRLSELAGKMEAEIHERNLNSPAAPR